MSLDAQVEEDRRELVSFVLRRCGNVEVANDVVSETLVAAARQLDDQGWPPRPWLVTVARRRLVDHFRREERRQKLVGNLAIDRAEPVDLPVEEDPEVWQAVGVLPRSQRSALLLRYCDGMTVGEVAAALCVSYQAAESLLARARRNFSQAYSAEDVRRVA